MEAIETALRAGVHRAGAAALSHLLSDCQEHPPRVACQCGAEAHYHDRRRKQLLTVLGPVEFERSYYVCPSCQCGQSPRDRELDVEGTEFSPGVRRMMATVGADTSFQRGRKQLESLAGLEVTTKAIERQAEAIGVDIEAGQQRAIKQAKQLRLPIVCTPTIPVLYIEMDGTGVPVTPKERAGRAGRKEGQQARTREVKLGCVFTQTTTDEEGNPVRDPASTSYVGAIESAELFGLRLYTEAWHRGWSSAQRKVVLGDGAIWIWNIAEQHFPGAIFIVDIWHAFQHVCDLAAKIFPGDEKQKKRWAAAGNRSINDGKIEAFVNRLRKLSPADATLAETIDKEAEYFLHNAERMRYPKFRALGLFVGSGVVEAGCRTVVGERLKSSGMFWSVRGANAILALRCSVLSNQFEDYWASRTA